MRIAYIDAARWSLPSYDFQGATYVALGDSYSSGEGTWNYDVPGYGPQCHTSSDSYPYYIASVTNYGTPDLVACSGALTDDLFRYSKKLLTPAGQFDNLGMGTTLVTLTIGGNDVGFSEVVRACLNNAQTSGFDCRLDSNLTNVVNARIARLNNGSTNVTINDTKEDRDIHPIVEVLREINLRAPNAEIYIGGYPRLFGDDIADFTADNSAPGGALCAVGGLSAVSYSDAQWMNARADELNGIIQDAVDEVVTTDSIDATYVPTNFAGHGLCDSGGALINPVALKPGTADPFPESMHPSVDGIYQGYGIPFSIFIN